MVRLNINNSPFAKRLAHHEDVGESELEQLEKLKFQELVCGRDEDIVERGSTLTKFVLLTSGWAIRYRYTPEGTRQIVHVLVPGDIVTPSVLSTKSADHGISALTDVHVRLVEPEDIRDLFCDVPALATAFWWAAEQEHGMLREQIVRLGRRSALERLSHMLLELYRRMRLIGEAREGTLELPLTQTDLADALGLSNVHVNRTLRKLVEGDYLSHQRSSIQISDPARLAALCDFDSTHLHLDVTEVES